MNNAERDMRIMSLGQRITHLAQDASSAWAFLEGLNRRLIGLAHRIYLLEQNADPMTPNYAALAESEPVLASEMDRDSAGLEG